LHGLLSQEAASLGAVGSISMKDTRIVIDARKLRIHTAEVPFLLAILDVHETTLSFHLNKIEGYIITVSLLLHFSIFLS